jgi:outer membrane usher protein
MKVAAWLCAALLLLPQAAAAEDQRAFLDIVLNGVSSGDALVILRTPDVLVQVATLHAAGMKQVAGRHEAVDGDEFVSLQSLAPKVGFHFDEQALRLTITADPALLGTTVYDLRADQPADLEYLRSRSGFVNYALSAGSGSSADYEAFTEAAYSHRAALFYNTASWTPRGVVRGVSSMTIDQRQHLRRWVAGDTFAGGEALGGVALLTGIRVSREFTLAP